MESARGKVRFGSFEFDFTGKELRQSGMRIRLSAAQIRLLTLFLEHPFVLITRDEIVDQLWGDPNSVDVATGINTAVNRLRSALNDSPAKPAYIETVIGLGYRFVAQVQPLSPENAKLDRRASDIVTVSDALSPVAIETMPIAAVAPAGHIEHQHHAETVEVPPAALLRSQAPPAVLVTSQALVRGRWRIAAVAGGALAIALAAVLTAVLPNLRARPAEAGSDPPNLSGSVVNITLNDRDAKVTAEAVSPNGEAIAYSDNSGVFLISLESHLTRLLASPAKLHATRIEWYPDGQHLAVSGNSPASPAPQLWQVSLQGTAPKLLAEDADLAVVSPDGKSIAFTRHQDTEIDIAEPDGDNPHKLISAGDKERFPFLLWARSGRFLIVERLSKAGSETFPTPVMRSSSPLNDLEAQSRWSCESIDLQTRKILARQDNLRFESGYLLEDGRLVYPKSTVFNAVAKTRVEMIHTDLSDGHVLGPSTLVDFVAGDRAAALTSSADGRRVAIILDRTTADLFVGKLRQPGMVLEEAKQISQHTFESYPHAWAPSGNAVLMESNRLSKDLIFEQPVDGSQAKLIAELPRDAAMAEFTPDGKWILFMQFSGKPNHADAIFRVPAAGGTPEQVPVTGEIDEFHCPMAEKGTCVLREAVNKEQFVYFALDPLKGIGKDLARTAWEPSLLGEWSVSPDGTTVAIANHDSLHPSIRLVSLVTNPTIVSEIPVEGLGALLGVIWAVDGRGFFVESKTESGYSLLYVDRKGHAKSLHSSLAPIWGVPSRDGTKLAFPELTPRRNVMSLSLGER